MIPTSPSPSQTGLLSRLSEHDRDRLGEGMRRLLTNGSIIGTEPSQTDLYHWCYQNREWLEDFAALLDLKLHWDHQERTVQAVPQNAAMILKLRLDATLILLVLWYEFDTAIRDRGEVPPVRLTVKQLNDSFDAKFAPLRKHLPSPTRLREILSVAQRKNLIRFTSQPDFLESRIEILSTLKRVIPFQNIEEWNRNADKYLASVKDLAPDDAAELNADGSEAKEEA